MTRSRRAAALAAILALGAALLPATAAIASGSGSVSTLLPQIEPQVMCVTCRIPLNTAKSPQATVEREYIKELILQGRDEAQIKRALVSQYGPAVLALPSTKGFNVVVYIVPAAAVLALAALLAFLLPRWRRASRDSEPTPRARPLSEADSERLQRDMARFD